MTVMVSATQARQEVEEIKRKKRRKKEERKKELKNALENENWESRKRSGRCME